MSTEVGRARQGSTASGLVHLLPAAMLAGGRAMAVAVQFLCQIAIANLAGPAGLGLFQLFNSWSSIVGEMLAQGLPSRTMRVVSVDFERAEFNRCRTFLLGAVRSVWGAARWAIVTATAFSIAMQFTSFGALQSQLVLAVAVTASLFAMLRVLVEGLKGVDAPVVAVSIESLVPPMLVLAVCLVCWMSGAALSLTMLLLAGAGGFAAALLLAYVSLRERMPHSVTDAARFVSTKEDRTEQRALWANSVLAILSVQLPFVLLPLFADMAEIGVFSVAHKLVSLITVLLVLMGAVFGPAFARAWGRGDDAALRGLLWRSQYLSLLMFAPLALVLLFALEALADVFNLSSQAIAPYLIALLMGQSVNAATGLPGLLLNMSGAADAELKTLLLSLIVTAIAAPLVGQAYGAVGIAWLISAALAGKNLASFTLARRHLMRTGGAL